MGFNYTFEILPNIKTTLTKWSIALRRLDKIIKFGVKVAFSEWKDWTPTTFTAGGAMTFTKTTSTGGKYLKIGDTVIYFFAVTGTTAGIANAEVYCDVPFLPNEEFRLTDGLGLCVINDTITFSAGVTNMRTGITGIVIRKYNNAVYALAAGVTIRAFGIYQCANLPENNIA